MTVNPFWRAVAPRLQLVPRHPDGGNDDAIVGMAMDIRDLDRNRLERDRPDDFSMMGGGGSHCPRNEPGRHLMTSRSKSSVWLTLAASAGFAILVGCGGDDTGNADA